MMLIKMEAALNKKKKAKTRMQLMMEMKMMDYTTGKIWSEVVLMKISLAKIKRNRRRTIKKFQNHLKKKNLF